MSARLWPVLAGLCCPLLAAADPPSLPPGAVARLGGTGLRHADRPICLAFSPDSKRLATGGYDGAVRVWDVATGAQVAAVTRPNKSVHSVQYTHGGARLAVNFLDGYIRFYDPDTLRDLDAPLAPTVGMFTVSPDSRLLATRTPNGGPIVVDELDTGLAKLELPSGPVVAFHPQSKLIAAADTKGVVTVYKVTGGKPVYTAAHGGPVNGLAFRPDGKAIATAGPAGKVRVWELDRPEPVAEVDAAGPITFVTNTRLGAVRGAAVGVYDFAAKSWVYEVREAAGAFAVSPDGTKLAATGTTGLRVRIWDLPSGQQLHAAHDAFPDPALLVPWPDGTGLFVIAGETAYLWRVGAKEPTVAGTFAGPVTVAAVGGRTLAVAAAHGLDVWDDFDPTKPLAEKPSRSVAGAGKDVRALAVSPDGTRLAVTGEDRTVLLADATAGKVLRPLPARTTALALAFTPDGRKLAVHGRDGYLRLIDLGTDRDLWECSVPRGPRGSIAVGADGRRVAVVSAIRITVIDAATGEKRHTLERPGLEGVFHAVAFSPDGRLLVSGIGGTTGGVQVWDAVSGRLRRELSTGLGGVSRVAVFPGGTRAASAGTDDAVTVWDLTAPPER